MGSALVSDDEFDDGWDMTASLVDGRWVDRSPRRPEIEPQVRREVAVMPWLAPQLPLPVPVPRIVSEDPLTVRHEYLPGGPCPGDSAGHGRAVGEFLRALHDVDPVAAVAHGLRDARSSYTADQEIRDRMAADVLPRLTDHLRAKGVALLERAAVPPANPRVVHADLGLDHLRVIGDDVTGVIDWGDSCVGDPAIDLAPTTVGAGSAFARAVLDAYGPDADVLTRARVWHLLGPWHEVLFGLDTGQEEYVGTGLAGVVTRLEQF